MSPQAPQADPHPSTLDGRSFHGVVLQAGKAAGDADTLVFAHGRFRSTACDQYGYGDGSYAAQADGDRIHFAAETESPQWGRLQWRGTVTANRLDGSLTMLRDGVVAGQKWVLAGEVDSAASDGDCHG